MLRDVRHVRVTPGPPGPKERLAKDISRHEQSDDSERSTSCLSMPDGFLRPLSGEDNGDSVSLAKAVLDGSDCSSKQL